MRCDIIIQFRHKLLEESVCDVSLGGRLALGEQYSRNEYCTEVRPGVAEPDCEPVALTSPPLAYPLLEDSFKSRVGGVQIGACLSVCSGSGSHVATLR